MNHASTTTEPRPPTAPRVLRSAAAVIAQYIHELSATDSPAPRPWEGPTAAGHCWGCA
jgi:hypothetical protein